MSDLNQARVAEFMATNPHTIGADQLAVDAVEMIERYKSFMQLLVVDDAGKLIGALHLHDLLRAKVL